ncbi:hypothetical protein [Kibdelosporangium philippinense]|uniref:hypothetical protein n=1 Tax=Kibdelosporangium philippinense TaxID=211113 RepID=UPI00360DC18D
MKVRHALDDHLGQDAEYSGRFADEVEVREKKTVCARLIGPIKRVKQARILQPVRFDLPIMVDPRQVQLVLQTEPRHGGAHPQYLLIARVAAPDVPVARRPNTARGSAVNWLD